MEGVDPSVLQRGKKPSAYRVKDQLVESGRQKTKENIIPHRKFRLAENDPKSFYKVLQSTSQNPYFVTQRDL